MASVEHVLAATDLSAPARHAADRAASLAHGIGASLALVHVAPTPALDSVRRFVTGVPEDLPERWLAETDAALRALAGALEARHGVAASIHLASGSLLGEIARAAEVTAADLIVLGARGSSFVRHLVLGSTAERLVAWCTRPMLVVKQVPHTPYRSVLVPVDFSAASLPALRLASAVAPGARIRVLHAFEAPFEGKLRQAGIKERLLREYRQGTESEARAQMSALGRQPGAPVGADALLLHGNAVGMILEQEQELDCDLIVIGKRGESRLEDLFLGSVTRRVLADSQCDVLVSPSVVARD
ncbi:MAG: universal stress protein [Rhizobacter sp.]